MPQIQQGDVRKTIRKVLRDARRQLPKELKQEATLYEIDRVWGSFIRQSRTSATKEVRRDFSEGLGAAHTGILATGLLGFGLIDANLKAKEIDPARELLPRDWLNEEARPTPNLLLGGHFTLIANYALAIVTLVEAGLEMPARVLMRALHEYVHLVLVLASDRDKMRAHHSAESPAEGREAYYKHFTPKKIARAIESLEARVGFDEATSGFFKERRITTHEYYTSAVHPTAVFGFVGAFALDKNDEFLRYALFGKSSLGSKNLLFDVALTLYYLLATFELIVEKIHKRILPRDAALFAGVHALRSALPEAIRTLNKQERAEGCL